MTELGASSTGPQELEPETIGKDATIRNKATAEFEARINQVTKNELDYRGKNRKCKSAFFFFRLPLT
ncbi:hypothetical protein Y032_0028g1817 [Ancylostoma ceylanicum]|uniref:Uncharacterized protein n=1 Tax=Ancylostoma ceylanicum TaxID=53326 RepID=A0A016UT22_9BILA|nr:hypothetical protein Y032_0028g1817 [Ancylostoma ceylanicum]